MPGIFDKNRRNKDWWERLNQQELLAYAAVVVAIEDTSASEEVKSEAIRNYISYGLSGNPYVPPSKKQDVEYLRSTANTVAQALAQTIISKVMLDDENYKD